MPLEEVKELGEEADEEVDREVGEEVDEGTKGKVPLEERRAKTL